MTTVTTLIAILGAVSIAASPAAYLLGRRSTVERELERRWSDDGTARPPVRDTLAADEADAASPEVQP